jgi:hypothetical protein
MGVGLWVGLLVGETVVGLAVGNFTGLCVGLGPMEVGAGVFVEAVGNVVGSGATQEPHSIGQSGARLPVQLMSGQ